ncbi:polynucleotide kinase [Bacillus phage SP-15]|uniref:Polynucleotide kinase n=1 Tax=Bacillus phage SP-15 TaxID=1792032 RepID=A0A127AWH2_9CAUD|nr:polynucleotide kinase [Bacillus phage SP-15]AMM44933.1 polynucleotide kinase [Bacillus phage SP-15]
MTKRVAFDIDDTLSKSMPKFVSELNLLTGKNIQFESIPELIKDLPIYSNPLFSLYSEVGDEVLSSHFRENEASWILNMEVMKDGLAKAKEHAELGHEIFYITARPIAVKFETVQWLMLHGFPVGEVFHNWDKLKMARNYNIDIFYEDNLHNAKLLADAGIETYLIDGVHNRQIDLGIERLYWK